MSSNQLQPILETVPLLLELGRLEGVLITLRHAFAKAKTRSDFLMVLHSSLLLPVIFRQQHLSFFLLLCYRAGNREVCLELLGSSIQTAEHSLYQAWLLVDEMPERALQLYSNLSQAELSLEQTQMVLRVVARASAHLQQSDWQAIYNKSLKLLQGRELGLCHLEYGYFLTRAGDETAARSEYAKALVLLEYDHHFAAHLNHSIGISCLRHDQLKTADTYLSKAIDLVKHSDAHTFRATAWLGLAMLRRAQGEYPVALQAYKTALDLAIDAEDRIRAKRGLGHCYRCLGKPDLALVFLEKALVEKGSPDSDELYADLAAAQLQLGNVLAASQLLDQVRSSREEDDRKTMMLALIDLHRKQFRQAKNKLKSLDSSRLWVREECQIFPELRKWLAFEPAPAFEVILNTDGAICLETQSHPIELSSKHPGAALAVYLVMHQNQADTERLLEALEISGKSQRDRQKNLNRAAHVLCQALGWNEALIVKDRSYKLASAIQWRLVLPATTRADFFCEGRNDPFIEEWRLVNSIDKDKLR